MMLYATYSNFLSDSLKSGKLPKRLKLIDSTTIGLFKTLTAITSFIGFRVNKSIQSTIVVVTK